MNLSQKTKIIIWHLLLLLNIAVMATGCVDYFVYSDDRLKILNRSNVDISISYSNDTDEIENAIDYYISDYNIIKPDSTSRLTQRGRRDQWNTYIAAGPEKNISIYIFAIDTLKAYNHLETIRSLCYHHKYLKKFTYTKAQLDKTNWKIVFSQ